MSIYWTLKKLLPGGQALRLFPGFDMQLLVEALGEYPDFIREFYQQTRDSGIPGFIPEDMCGEWEEIYRLTGVGLTVEERNAQIAARDNAVGSEGKGYLENVLNDAFRSSITQYPRYVITARAVGAPPPFDWSETAGDPDVSAGQFEDRLFDAKLTIYEDQGDPKLIPGKLVVKSADDDRSLLNALDPDYYPGVFVISGPDGVGSWMDMSADREFDFVKKLLQIKPISRWAIVQVNFV